MATAQEAAPASSTPLNGIGACGLRAALRRPATAVSTLAAVALLGLAWAGAAFWVPLVMSCTLAVLLWPALMAVERVLKLRVLAALVVTTGALAATVLAGFLIASQVAATLDRVPDVLRQAAKDVQALPSQGRGTWQRTQQALEELDRAVARATGTNRGGATAAKPVDGSIVTTAVAWSATALAALSRSAGSVALHLGAIVLLTFFLLCSGERLAAQVSRWCDGPGRFGLRAGPLGEAGRFSPLVSDLALEMRRFGAVTLITNAAIAVAVALGFVAFGIADAWAWGLLAGALHFVPYAGLALTMLLAAVEVYATQGSGLATVAVVAYVALVGVALGNGLAPWLQGRASKVDSAVTFGGTLFVSVLWGGWGLVLGPLLVVMVLVVARHLQGTEPAAEAVLGVAEVPQDDTPGNTVKPAA
jgi:predicted PurR-regulated permease PerM